MNFSCDEPVLLDSLGKVHNLNVWCTLLVGVWFKADYRCLSLQTADEEQHVSAFLELSYTVLTWRPNQDVILCSYFGHMHLRYASFICVYSIGMSDCVCVLSL